MKRRNRLTAGVLTAGLLLVGGALTACSSSISKGSIESELVKQNEGVLKAVTCTSDLDATAGATITCAGTGSDGTTIEYIVTIDSVRSDGTAAWSAKVSDAAE